MTQFDIILRKLEQFRRRYYLFRLMRGSLVLVLLGASLFLAFALTEGALWLSPTARTVLVSVLAAACGAVLAVGVVWPLLQYLRVGRTLSDAEAARLIGRHFADVDDKLLNLLQYRQMGPESNALLAAAIEQRTEQLRPVPFPRAVSFRPNWRLARYLAIPALVALFLLVFNKDLLTKGSYRLLNFDEHFQPPPPFEIQIPNHVAQLIEGQDHTIDIRVGGRELPAELFLYRREGRSGGFQRYSLQKKSTTQYEFSFRNVRRDFEYYIGNERYGTSTFGVEVLQRPALNSFYVVLMPPAYTRLPAETLATNVGDLSALRGTLARWHFRFKGPVAKAAFHLSDTALAIPVNDTGAVFARQLLANADYAIHLTSAQGVLNQDTVRYRIQVQEDKYPSVVIESPAYESTLPPSGIINLRAELSDDFGFTRAELHYRFTKSTVPGKVSKDYRVVPLPVLFARNLQTIEQRVDFIRYDAASGDEIEYYVKVWDNDAISGPKASVSMAHKIVYQSTETLYAELNETGQELEKQLENALSDAAEMQKNFEQIEKKLLEKKNLNYEDKKEVKELIKKQQELMKQLDEAQQLLDQQIENADQNQLLTEETLQKMQKLEKLLQEMATPEMKKFLEELQKRLDEMSNQELKQKMEQFKLDNESLQKDLERTLELFQQLKVDQKTQELIQKLDNLKDQQEMLQERLQDAKSKEEFQQIQEKQKELNQKMKDLAQDLKDLKDLKEETQTPDSQQMQELEEQRQDTEQDMKQAEQKIGQQQKKQAAQQQKQAQQKMQQMMEQLEQMQRDNEQQQQAENYEDLRNLLENLLRLSFEQEDVRDRMAALRPGDPQLKALTRRQAKVRDDMQMIDDSLRALAKRAIEIEQFVTDELKKIQLGLKRTVDYLSDNKTAPATGEQHQVMTHVNNLANMLLESLNSMQQAMQMAQGMGKGCKMPKNPGSMPGMQQLKDQQQQLNKSLSDLLKQGNQNPDKLREMAAQQEAIRKKIQEMFQKMSEQGEKGLGSTDKITEDMKMTETELRDRLTLNAELMQRQQRILDRMLDFDKAMREREYDNKRKATTATERPRVSPAELPPDQLRERIRKENYSKDKYQYAPLYQNLIEEYYKLLDERR